MRKIKVLLTYAYQYNNQQIEQIEALGYEVLVCKNELLEVQEDYLDADVVVANNLFLYNKLKKFKKIKMIQLTSAGLDRVPLQEISKRSIQLSNAKSVYSIPIAEWVILKILEIYKNTRFFETNQKNKKWTKNRNLFELNGKTIGIVGTGSIGKEIAKRAKVFGCEVLGVNTTGNDVEYFDRCYSIREFNRVISQSNIIVLSLPLNENTKNLIDYDKLELLAQNSILVNISRGGIINEKDLLKYLNSENNQLLGVALDVFEEEPLPTNNPLWQYPEVIATPHNSFISDNVSERMFELIYNNLKYFKNEQTLENEIII